MTDLKEQLFANAEQWGADLIAVADTTRMAGMETRPDDLLNNFPRAISIAVQLADGIIDTIVDTPTEIYSQHYQRVNALLDNIACRVSSFIQSNGGKALPIPASQILCEERFVSYISHKAVAINAGLGWQGKSLLLVTPQYGPRIRLVTILTDLNIAADEPIKNRCGKCTKCTDACPAGAIKNVNTELHYSSRNEAVSLSACVDHLNKVSGYGNLMPYICGVCVASCPWGKKKRQPHQGTAVQQNP
ncbi:4Fe-4S double cluster binding domain-containing protein [Maridesulfovibrio salexigens]|uniref:4Fe-4S ferredoxin iron-sulfur binding domain protein n=1 Tax=Maridesulfovibrio salexigens (strain ATCC 14822 / DSM 2638 / NCIMB 8403 / VKM B-1763) TaxID=526222 RepID=C6BVD2_MARSD|nr:4Fe-4S double cluster binding domain-containing protein [Maridesulfovibrio salexigens]ACS80107.1 4Fe-4S ferredoxin iron-sulfur binding domain protein [Maridesulfovibrio salexigens DSM 2638]